MTILCDDEITSGKYLSIDDLRPENLTPNGYDVTISEVMVGVGGERVTSGVANVPPKTWFAVSTLEYVRFGPRVAGELWIKTSWARKGVISSFGMIDAGFEGNLTLAAFNGSDEALDVEVGRKFAQLVVHLLDREPAGLYHERSGNYQGQKGVTLSKD